MTNYECESLFLSAMDERRIVCYKNQGSKDHYQIHAWRKTKEGVVFFCFVETFFLAVGQEKWLQGSIRSFHEFTQVLGATPNTLKITDEHFTIQEDYRTRLPAVPIGEDFWTTID
jgi:hypothetical protein